MSLRRLIMILAATALLAGAGVAGAFASSPGHATLGVTTATTTCTGKDDQGDNEHGDEESDAASEVEQAAAKVDQEAGRQQGDDQTGYESQADEQGEEGDERKPAAARGWQAPSLGRSRATRGLGTRRTQGTGRRTGAFAWEGTRSWSNSARVSRSP